MTEEEAKMTPDTTALMERLELMAKVFDTVSSGSLYSRTIREASTALQAAETRAQEAEQRADTTSKLGRFLIECADLQRQAAETRAQQAEARVEELEKALSLARPFLALVHPK